MVDTMHTNELPDALPTAPPARTRRRHSKAFKQRLVAQCQQGEQSLASLALANNINANLLRKWVNFMLLLVGHFYSAADSATGLLGGRQ